MSQMSDYATKLMENSQTRRFLLNVADFYQHNFFVLHPNFDYCHKAGKESWNEDKIRTFHILKQAENLGTMREAYVAVQDMIRADMKEKEIEGPTVVLEAARSKIKELALENIRKYLADTNKIDPKTFEESFRFYFSRDIGNHLTKSYDQETKFIRHLAQEQVREVEEMLRK